MRIEIEKITITGLKISCKKIKKVLWWIVVLYYVVSTSF